MNFGTAVSCNLTDKHKQSCTGCLLHKPDTSLKQSAADSCFCATHKQWLSLLLQLFSSGQRASRSCISHACLVLQKSNSENQMLNKIFAEMSVKSLFSQFVQKESCSVAKNLHHVDQNPHIGLTVRENSGPRSYNTSWLCLDSCIRRAFTYVLYNHLWFHFSFGEPLSREHQHEHFEAELQRRAAICFHWKCTK